VFALDARRRKRYRIGAAHNGDGTANLGARGFPYEGKRWIVVARQLVSETTRAGVTVGLALAEGNLFTVLRDLGAALVAANACEDGYVHGGDELALAEARGLPASR
jgi:hypothetical protein